MILDANGVKPTILRQNPPWGPERVWEDHCSSIPRVQQKHPILRLPSGHAGDFSPFRHPDWELVRCSFRPRPRPLTTDADTVPPVPRVGRPRLLPCPLSSEHSQRKKGGKKTILSQQPPDPLHVAGHQDSAASVVVTAAAERANRRHHPTSNTLDKSRPSTTLSASSQPSLSPTSYRPRNLPRFDGQVPAAWADAVASFTSKGVRGRSVVRPLPFRQRIPTALQPPLFAPRSFPLSISPPSSPRPYVCYGYSLYDTLSPS